jgi:hypothetical protein
VHSIGPHSTLLNSLQDFDSNEAVEVHDTTSRFFLNGFTMNGQRAVQTLILAQLFSSWSGYTQRMLLPDEEWFTALCSYLETLVQARIDVVQHWISVNTARFIENTSAIETLRRESNSVIAELKASVQLCGMKCGKCHLSCLGSRHHDGSHNCLTTHNCIRSCEFVDEHSVDNTCGLPYVNFFIPTLQLTMTVVEPDTQAYICELRLVSETV